MLPFLLTDFYCFIQRCSVNPVNLCVLMMWWWWCLLINVAKVRSGSSLCHLLIDNPLHIFPSQMQLTRPSVGGWLNSPVYLGTMDCTTLTFIWIYNKELWYKRQWKSPNYNDLCEGLHFIQTLNDRGKEKCKCSIGLFSVLNERFIPQHNEKILSMQNCKLSRIENESAEKWVGQIKIKANEYKYKEKDRCPKQQSINCINSAWWQLRSPRRWQLWEKPMSLVSKS